jgi:hypothetical protein
MIMKRIKLVSGLVPAYFEIYRVSAAIGLGVFTLNLGRTTPEIKEYSGAVPVPFSSIASAISTFANTISGLLWIEASNQHRLNITHLKILNVIITG